MRPLVALAAALALAGVGPAATNPRIAAVQWDGKAEGGAKFVTGGETTWILSGGLGEANVFRMAGRSLVPRSVPLRMRYLFAGDGQLWGVQGLEGGNQRLVSIDVRHGYRLRAKTMPRGCIPLSEKTLVHRGRLWFQCDFDRLLVYDPQRAAPVREFRTPGMLVESTNALWRYNINDALECVEGPCRGADIAVGASGAWDAEGDTGWTVREGATADEAFLTLVGFRARGVADFTLKVPRALGRPSELRVVGDELWVQGGPVTRFAVARYRINAPELPPRLLRLPGLSPSAETAWPVETGGDHAWVSIRDRGEYKVFRVALPRDPPALRQIRTAVLVASVRTPARLGVPRGAGAPMHASCEARDLYLQVRAYYCTVRFRRGAEYMCVAVVRGRVVVDRRRAPKWACS